MMQESEPVFADVPGLRVPLEVIGISATVVLTSSWPKEVSATVKAGWGCLMWSGLFAREMSQRKEEIWQQ